MCIIKALTTKDFTRVKFLSSGVEIVFSVLLQINEEDFVPIRGFTIIF